MEIVENPEVLVLTDRGVNLDLLGTWGLKETGDQLVHPDEEAEGVKTEPWVFREKTGVQAQWVLVVLGEHRERSVCRA